VLPRAHRLRRSAEFAGAVRRGRRAGTTTVVVHESLRDDAEPARVGFVVARTVGGAVVRNRTKRRLRALMAERVDRLPPHVSVVVRANPPAAHATYAELARDMDSCLSRLARRGAAAAPGRSMKTLP
jgi:ribonuclease P protein component